MQEVDMRLEILQLIVLVEKIDTKYIFSQINTYLHTVMRAVKEKLGVLGGILVVTQTHLFKT